MVEKNPTPDFEDVRRAGLNPAADYGGAEQMAVANEAIAQAKADFAAKSSDEPEQMSLFSSFEEPVDETPQRAVLGSRAIRGAMTESRYDDVYLLLKDDPLNPEGRSKAALEEQKRADQAFMRSFGRGRGPGR